jgi:hypothetical protein
VTFSIIFVLTAIVSHIIYWVMKKDYDHLATVSKEQNDFKKKRGIWKLKNLDAD